MSEQSSYSTHVKRLLILGLPLVGGHLAQFAIHMTDTIMLGWYDVSALAAAVLGGTYFFVQFIFLSGFAMAVVPAVATAAANDDERQIRRITRMAIWISVLAGAATLPVFLFAAPILGLMGQVPETSELAATYLRIAGLGMIPALLVMVLKSYLSALERTAVVLWVTIGAALVNALVNYALIFGNLGAPELGITGAAIASVVVQIVSVIGVALYAVIVEPEHTLFKRIWRPDWEAFRSLFQLGWPIGLTTLAEVGLFAASAIMVGWVGTIDLAAHGIAIQLASLAFMLHLGISNAGTIRVGQAWGRGDMDALRKISIATNAVSGVFATVTILLFVLFPTALIGLFVDPMDPVRPEVIAAGVSLLYVAAFFQLADAGQVQALGLLRGMHDTRVPMIMAACSYWIVGVPVSYFLGFAMGYGAVGVWTGLVVGLSLAWFSMGWRLWGKIANKAGEPAR